MKTGIELIALERNRQIQEEGWTASHDADHTLGALADAAASYAMTDKTIDFINDKWGNDMHLHIWPFHLKYFKRTPTNRIRDLQKAGALIAAEIDRLLKADEPTLEESNFLFAAAIRFLKNGYPVRRSSWPKGTFIFMQLPAQIGMATVPKMTSVPENVKSIFQNRQDAWDKNPELKNENPEIWDQIRYSDQIALVDAKNNIKGYSPSAEDVLSEDWVLAQ